MGLHEEWNAAKRDFAASIPALGDEAILFAIWLDGVEAAANLMQSAVTDLSEQKRALMQAYLPPPGSQP
jgi:hypothetical protein